MLLILLLACDGPGTKLDDSGLAGATPQLWYYPDTLSFSPATEGSASTKEVTLRNTGSGDLVIRTLAAWGSGAFDVATMPPSAPIKPGEILTVTVQFTPTNPHDTGGLTIMTNDPANPSVDVPLEGFALVPSLALSANPMDFGVVPTGCTISRTLSVENVGYATLRVDELVNTNPLFELPDFELPLEDPVFIEVGDSWDFNVTYHSITEGVVDGELWFTGNDILGVNVGILTAEGTADTTGLDEFWQPSAAETRADVLVFVSRTSSMSDNEGATRNNLDAFADALARTPLDWQLGVVTGDDGCVNVGVVTPVNFSDGAVLDSAFTGDFGLLTDEGLTVIDNALQKTGEGQCNQGLLRNVSKPVIVLIADGAEQSAQGWEALVADIQARAPGAIIHAVAPATTGDCPTSVQGAGYFDAAQATGGATLDFCGNNWGGAFDDVFGLLYSGPATTFELTSIPDEASLDVRVNGAAANGWTYSATANAIIFEEPPEAGAHITVQYDLGATCE